MSAAPDIASVRLALADLDSAVHDSHRWARLLMDLSSGSAPVELESLGIVADAMNASAKSLREKFTVAWQAAGGAK